MTHAPHTYTFPTHTYLPLHPLLPIHTTHTHYTAGGPLPLLSLSPVTPHSHIHYLWEWNCATFPFSFACVVLHFPRATLHTGFTTSTTFTFTSLCLQEHAHRCTTTHLTLGILFALDRFHCGYIGLPLTVSFPLSPHRTRTHHFCLPSRLTHRTHCVPYYCTDKLHSCYSTLRLFSCRGLSHLSSFTRHGLSPFLSSNSSPPLLSLTLSLCRTPSPRAPGWTDAAARAHAWIHRHLFSLCTGTLRDSFLDTTSVISLRNGIPSHHSLLHGPLLSLFWAFLCSHSHSFSLHSRCT